MTDDFLKNDVILWLILEAVNFCIRYAIAVIYRFCNTMFFSLSKLRRSNFLLKFFDLDVAQIRLYKIATWKYVL